QPLYHFKLTNLEAVATTIITSSKFNICNIYLPPNLNISNNDIAIVLEQIPSPRIIIGDFNAHNEIWGSISTDARGRIIESIIDRYNLNLLNDGNQTRFNSFTGNFSTLDLSICDPQTGTHLEWDVIPHIYGSYHRPIKITKQDEEQRDSLWSPRWKIDKANWPKYREEIENKINTVNHEVSSENINEILEDFTRIIQEAAIKHVKKTSALVHHTPVPWWNAECDEAVKRSKHQFNYYKRHKTKENLILFKKARARARYIIKKSKKESWQKFTLKINHQTPISTVWKKIRRINGKKTEIKATTPYALSYKMT
ncbi:hypothetical protein PPYR_08687, partial [Photinus pyralis]